MKHLAIFSRSAGFPKKALTLLVAALFPAVALSDFDIAQKPLMSATQIEPNLVYIHDDSGSMTWTHMPDDAITTYTAVNATLATGNFSQPSQGNNLLSAEWNGMYYNPETTYQPPFQYVNGRLVRMPNSDTLTTYPQVRRSGYPGEGTGTDTLSVNITATPTLANLNNSGQNVPPPSSGVALYWDYVPGYHSMRDNPNYSQTYTQNPGTRLEDDEHNYEFWAFRTVTAGAYFRTNNTNSTFLNRDAQYNRSLVASRACPTMFPDVVESRAYYGANNPHGQCRIVYRSNGVTNTAGVTRGANAFANTTLANSPNGRPWCVRSNSSSSRTNGTNTFGNTGSTTPLVWQPYSTGTSATTTHPHLTCYAGRHVIGDTTGSGYYDPAKDSPNAYVSYFEYSGSDRVGATANSMTNHAATAAANCMPKAQGVCTNLYGPEQSRLHLVTSHVGDDGELVEYPNNPRRRTSREEIRNFMNWYTYYRSRVMSAKAGMSIAFAQLVDNNDTSKPSAMMNNMVIRLGYDTINSGSMNTTAANRGPGQSGSNRGGIGVVPFLDFSASATKPEDGTASPYRTQRFVQRFYDWVLGRTTSGGTPLTTAFRSAGEYYMTDAPWRDYPPGPNSAAEGGLSSCRRSFGILMTDGYNNLTPTAGCAATNADCHDNADGLNITGDGVTYKYTPQTPFANPGHRNTLADWAMYYWKTDLRPAIANDIAGYTQTPTPQEPTAGNPAFWQHMQTFTIGLGAQGNLSSKELKTHLGNPGNWGNPVNGTGQIAWNLTTTGDDPSRVDDLFHAGINGHGDFFDARDAKEFADALRKVLLSLAGTPTSNTGFAGSGGMRNQPNMLFSASYNPTDWSGALEANVQSVCLLADGSEDKVAIQNGACVVGNPVNPRAWEAGAVLANRLVNPATGLNNPVNLANRNIFTWDRAGKTGVNFNNTMPGGVKSAIDVGLDRGFALPDNCPILRPGAPTAACILGSAPNTVPYNVNLLIDYLRGNIAWEEQAGVVGFRSRSKGGAVNFLGDIVNSTPYVQGNNLFNDAGYGRFDCGQGVHVPAKESDPSCKTHGSAFFSDLHLASYRARAMALHANRQSQNLATRLKNTTVYVGANDGMLHAFDAEYGGVELFAYVPAGIHGKLKQLADPNYNQKHTYFVDGTPMVRDILLDTGAGENWHSVLVGNTGRGGRSFFALDVENPRNFSANDVLWEITGAEYPDLGFPADGEGVIAAIAGLPNKWGVIFGNGYNSDNNEACLFAVELKKNPIVEKVCVPKDSANRPNGLGVPVWVDDVDDVYEHADGLAEFAYAGDALGNLWKFDLRNFTVANQGQPMLRATAVDGGLLQPISAPPLPVVLPGNGEWRTLQLVLGTGKYFEQADLNDPVIQSIYGIRDFYVPASDNGIAERSNLMVRDYTVPHPTPDMFCRDRPCPVLNPELKESWRILTNNPPIPPQSPVYGTGPGQQLGWVIDFTGYPAHKMNKWRVRAQGTTIWRVKGGVNEGIATNVLVPTVIPAVSELSCSKRDQGGGIVEIDPQTGGARRDGNRVSRVFRGILHESNIWVEDGSYGAEINRDGKWDYSGLWEYAPDPDNPGKVVKVYFHSTDNARGAELGKKKRRNPCDSSIVISGKGATGDSNRCEGARAGRQSWRQIR